MDNSNLLRFPTQFPHRFMQDSQRNIQNPITQQLYQDSTTPKMQNQKQKPLKNPQPECPASIRIEPELKAHATKIQNSESIEYLVQFPEPTAHPSLKRTDNSACSRKESAKNSTAKYRQKKKKELTQLEQSVKHLQCELASTDSQIHSTKQKILTALQTLAKMNQRSSNQNIEIYNQLETLLNQNSQREEGSTFVDFDKINLLLDTLKYRIGASGKQRQSKLAYHYKSIVNTLFPALYRYILFSSMQKFDLFDLATRKASQWQWTNQLIKKLQIRPDQVQLINSFKLRLQQVHDNTQQSTNKLTLIRERIKNQCLKVEGIEEQMREFINPIQCARFAVFAEKYKYRSQLMFQLGFFQDGLELGFRGRGREREREREGEREGEEARGKKRVKLTKE